MRVSLFIILLVVILFSLFFSGCYYQKSLPVERDVSVTKVPIQQEILSESVHIAVDGLNFSTLKGQPFYVDVIGVFPHNHSELLDYIKANIEVALAKAGALISRPAIEIQDGKIIRKFPENVVKVTVGVSHGGVDKTIEVDSRGIWKTIYEGRIKLNIMAVGPNFGFQAFGEGVTTYKAYPLGSSDGKFYVDPVVH